MVLANNNMDMFAVSVFEEYIYWSDRSVQWLICSLNDLFPLLFYLVILVNA